MLKSAMHACTVKKSSVVALKAYDSYIVVSLVALILEANCMRQPVSLLFPLLFFHFETSLREGNNKETTSLLVS